MRRALQTPDDFTRALEEARARLEGLQTAAPDDAESLDDLLRRIADYHDRQPPAEKRLLQDQLRAFDDHLNAYGRRWPKSDADSGAHWSPMLGGDVHPR